MKSSRARALVVVTCAALLTYGSVRATAQHDKHDAPAKPTPAAATPKPEPAKPDVKAAAQPATQPGPATMAKSPPTAAGRSGQVKAAVARIQERIKTELGSVAQHPEGAAQKAVAPGAASPTNRPPHASTATEAIAKGGGLGPSAPNRVQLRWRLTLDWPAEVRY